MNIQIVGMQTSVATTHSEPGKLWRLGMFIFVALPGAWLVGTCGSLIVNAAGFWTGCMLAVLLMAGAELLLYGTHTNHEPLFLLVFVPMPILIALGYRFGYLGNDVGFFIAILGMTWPMIIYRPVSRYYKRRAFRRSPAQRSAHEETSKVESCKLQVEKSTSASVSAFDFEPSIFDHPLND